MHDLHAPLLMYGYPLREAQWVRLVMIHAGVFLRRQYRHFIGQRTRGGDDQRLITRLLGQQHAVTLQYHQRERLYHVRSRALYAAIGHAHARHRRALPPLTMAHRLIALDLLLTEPRPYIERTQDLVQVFLDRFAVPRVALPQQTYVSSTAPDRRTIQYFPARYLTAIEGEVVSFVVPDLRPRTALAFDHFLAAYGALIRALPSVELVYVTPRGETPTRARQRYQQVLEGGGGTDRGEVELMDHCFTVRRAIEQRTDALLAPAIVQQYRQHDATFRGEPYASWYRAWVTGGRPALIELALQHPSRPSRVRFRHVATSWAYYCQGRATQFAHRCPSTRPGGDPDVSA